jgi:hypothetical protein
VTECSAVSRVSSNYLETKLTNPRSQFLQFLYSTVSMADISLICRLNKPSANRYKRTRWLQASLFVLSVVSGTRMIYLVNYGNWLVNMQQVRCFFYAPNTIVNKRLQCPPLGTIWVYTILQLDLGPAVLALSAVGFWVWRTGARLVFN